MIGVRDLLVMMAFATPTQAWEFTPGPPCILSHDTGTAQVELTFDPGQPLYTITVTRASPWPDAPVFAMAFHGPMARKIATDRHRLGTDGRSLTVVDRGFGNLLDGLQYNETARAIMGRAEVMLPLQDAPEPVRRFRACDLPLS